jgi:methionine synthase II (cobalamin-independent)
MTAFAASAPSKTDSLPIFRADHIGSFLRPRSLLDAREKFRRRELNAGEFRSIEDQAISEVVRLQESAGLECITDGEFRREYFHLDFLSQLGGVQTSLPVIETGADGKQHLTPPTIRVIDKVRHVKDIQLADFLYLQSVTNRTPKVTIPSPTMLHFRGGRDAINRQAYPDLEEFYQDVADAYSDRSGRPDAAWFSSTIQISRIYAIRRCVKARYSAAMIRRSFRIDTPSFSIDCWTKNLPVCRWACIFAGEISKVPGRPRAVMSRWRKRCSPK